MQFDQLLDELHKLNRVDKLRVVQSLVNKLVEEEEGLNLGNRIQDYSQEMRNEIHIEGE